MTATPKAVTIPIEELDEIISGLANVADRLNALAKGKSRELEGKKDE